MKRIIFIIAIVMLSGCDFIRTVAGRPTSAEVEEIRVERERAEEAAHQARLDSMRRVQQQMADSLAALEAYLLDSLSHTKGAIMNPDRLGGVTASGLETKYCIVVGAFREMSNAQRKLAACNKAGYKATIVSFRNGLNAVAICPSDNLDSVLTNLKAIRGKDICPKDGWILVNK